jgi:5-formyltetrahydrofolate cyclo-ligase
LSVEIQAPCFPKVSALPWNFEFLYCLVRVTRSPLLKLGLVKESIRKEMLRLRSLQAEEERIRKSQAIQKKIFELAEVAASSHVLIYLSLSSEVRTEVILEKLREMGKTIYVPIIERGKRGDMLISRLPAVDVLEYEKGPLGIFQPARKCWDIVSQSAIDFVLMPGLAFDLTGGRLGFGAGYYDRMLAKHRSHIKRVGLAFDFQIIDSVPQSDTDVPVEIIVTESRTIRCNT